jgi:serine phosphatase RsbU (regulator of sigma subunit)
MDGGLSFRFITLLIAVLNPETHEIKLANAGHLPPVLRRANLKSEFIGLKGAGVPLGIMPDSTYQQISFTINPGDTCIFYTDGVTETMNDDEQLYGRTRLSELVEKLASPIDQIIKGIVADVEEFGGHIAPRDDMCIVGVEHQAAR